jgi:GMP synthase-like glutamine amidotransferase
MAGTCTVVGAPNILVICAGEDDARRLRAAVKAAGGDPWVIAPPRVAVDELLAVGVDGVVLCPCSMADETVFQNVPHDALEQATDYVRSVLGPFRAWAARQLGVFIERRVPVLGICTGAQLVAEALGGELSYAQPRDRGSHAVSAHRSRSVVHANRSRGVLVSGVRPEVSVDARSLSSGATEAFSLADPPVSGVLFHPELSGKGVSLQVFEAFLARTRRRE